ncbi:MAG: L-threonylcarbamoyladenylate synthase [Defluviitaleaceae bacterium]|nr:L-threonylcarbamoyladenylate synthase [Defluviitaleaceae bacterium]
MLRIDTVVENIEVGSASVDIIKQAARIIKSGGLVAFPTETVYGLGANALDEAACAKIYEAKGRPGDNPLIVHINEGFELVRLAREVPPGAQALMGAFSPGPLTVILPARPGIFAHGYGDTVAVRLPGNMAARLLIHHAGVPIAAPSANLSGSPSPTTAAHVLADLDGRVDMVLDGGACKHGMESTVVDFTDTVPKILRPGAITQEMIANVIGKVEIAGCGEAAKSPGMKYRHYAPSAKMTLVIGNPASVSVKILELLGQSDAKKPVILVPTGDKALYGEAPIMLLGRRIEEVTANIYAALRRIDELGHDEVFVQGVVESGLGLAVMNRLRKAAGNNVIIV